MDWDRHITSYVVDPPKAGRSLCQYLADESEEVGMRVYVEWIFHRSYRSFLDRFALSRQVQQANERVLVVRYEDLASSVPCRQQEVVQRMLNFFFNGTVHQHFHDKVSQKAVSRELDSSTTTASQLEEVETPYRGGHSTSHDPVLRDRLKAIIRKLDQDHYDGEISWMNSFVLSFF